MDSRPRIALVEARLPRAISPSQVARDLPASGRVLEVHTPAELVAAASASPLDGLLIGFGAPGLTPAHALSLLRTLGQRTEVVILADEADVAEAVALVDAGARDVVLRTEAWRLSLVLRRWAGRGEPPDGRPDDRWLRAVLDQCADGLLVVDADGQIAWLNQPAARMYGLQDAPTVGLDARMVLPADWRLHAGSGPRDVTARRADGASFPVELSMRSVVIRGEPLTIVNLRDITDRKALERQLQESQRLDTFATLAAGVSHEFNNILTALLTYTGLVRRDLGPDHPSAEDVAAIEETAERAGEIVHRLLAVSRRPAGPPSRVDLNRLVGEGVALLARALGSVITVDVDLAPGLPALWADGAQAQQVLTNLVLNARDAMPEGGRIVVSTRLLEVEEPRPGLLPVGVGRYAVLAVRDTGAGMDEATRLRAFEPFFTTGGGAVGLGLPVVYGIVRQHGGFVEIESEPGVGTVVTVGFPLGPGVPSEVAAPFTTRGSETILLADDDDAVRGVVARILGSHGYVVVPARDGADAVERLRADPKAVGAAVLDVRMPSMGARELHRRLRELSADLPVLWVSGFSGGDAVPRDEATDFLGKPFAADELTRRLRALLDRAHAS